MPRRGHARNGRAVASAGFRLYWGFLSKVRKQVGRKRLSKEVRELIFRMVAENPTWGAPRIHGELQMLGIDVSERSISRWLKQAPRDPEPARRWLAVLRNHREAIAAMDFFTVPTATFSLLYCFFIITIARLDIRRSTTGAHASSDECRASITSNKEAASARPPNRPMDAPIHTILVSSDGQTLISCTF